MHPVATGMDVTGIHVCLHIILCVQCALAIQQCKEAMLITAAKPHLFAVGVTAAATRAFRMNQKQIDVTGKHMLSCNLCLRANFKLCVKRT